MYLFFCGEVCADELFVVSDVNVFVCEGGMGPADAAVELPPCRLYEFCTADFVEALRREFADDKLAEFIEHPYIVLVFYHVNVGPAVFRDGVEAFPDSVAGVKVETSKLAITIHAVDVVTQQDGRGNAAMETVGSSFIGAFSLPDFFDSEPVRDDFDH